MLATKDSFTFGRAESCDLHVAGEKHLASVHMQLERLLDSPRASLKATDVSSGKNDIVFGEVAVKEFVMGAGDWFEIGDTRYFVLSEEMRLARSTVMEVLGIRQYPAIDDLLVSAVRDSSRHVLLIGEPGCDQDRLGRVVHQVSHRRHNRFHSLGDRPKFDSKTRQDLSDASNGTVLVPMHHKGKLDPRVVAALVQPSAKLRLILCARSPDKAEASFPAELVNDAKKITIPPLRERATEIPEILDQWFVVRRSPLRVAALRLELREALRSYTWPENLQELRETADLLVELAHYRSARQATSESAVSRGVLRGWLKKLQITLQWPIVPEKSE